MRIGRLIAILLLVAAPMALVRADESESPASFFNGQPGGNIPCDPSNPITCGGGIDGVSGQNQQSKSGSSSSSRRRNSTSSGTSGSWGFSGGFLGLPSQSVASSSLQQIVQTVQQAMLTHSASGEGAVLPGESAPRILIDVVNAPAGQSGINGNQQPAANEHPNEPQVSQPSIAPTTSVSQEHPAQIEHVWGSGSTTVSHEADTAHSLEDIGKTVYGIEAARGKVRTQIQQIVQKHVEQAIESAAHSLPVQGVAPTATSSADRKPIVFSEEARKKLLDRVQSEAEKRGEQISSQLSDAIASPESRAYIPGQLDPVLKSSLADISQLIHAETGVAVSVEPGARQVSADIKQIDEAAKQVSEQRQALAQRDGIDLYRDTDKDGISDYDEKYIYHTDPNNAYTSGSSLTDGERVLLGLDALKRTPTLVPVESPKDSGQETSSVFQVTNIAYVQSAAPATSTAPAPAPAPAAAPSTQAAVAPAPAAPQPIIFTGTALPNSFVTLFVYSTPIVVTVKADENGAWSYTLDTQLENGDHTLYVASVDNSGKVLAKSAPVPFTKTAEALQFEPLTVQEAAAPTPLDTLRANFLVTGGVLLLLFALVAIVAVGAKREGAAL